MEKIGSSQKNYLITKGLFPVLPKLPSKRPMSANTDKPRFVFGAEKFRRLHQSRSLIIEITLTPERDESSESREILAGRRLATKCQHTDRVAYCKDMCNYCYNLTGRPGNQTFCMNHADRINYCKNRCRACYLAHRRTIQISVKTLTNPKGSNHV